MDQFVGTFLSTAVKHRYDCGDIVDQLNYYYTAFILLTASLTLFAKQYVGQPIQCWVPVQFTGAWEKYAETYCFIQNTYYHPLNEHLPQNLYTRQANEIGYYQWVPLVLVAQAIMFWLPSAIWRMMYSRSSMHVKEMLMMSGTTRKSVDDGGRKKIAMNTADKMDEALAMKRQLGDKKKSRLPYPDGVYLVPSYLFCKLLYIGNLLLQFVLMNLFLGTRSTWWGAAVLNDLAHGRTWEDTGHFPRVTMCDFKVMVLGNLHNWTIQCVLMINMFTEKIYIFLWWWFLLVLIVTCLNLVWWTLSSVAMSRRNWVTRYLRVKNCIEVDGHQSSAEEASVDRFMDTILRPDGVLLMKLVQINGGDLLTGDVIEQLWNKHMTHENADRDQSGFTEETPTSEGDDMGKHA